MQHILIHQMMSSSVLHKSLNKQGLLNCLVNLFRYIVCRYYRQFCRDSIVRDLFRVNTAFEFLFWLNSIVGLVIPLAF